MYDSPKTFRLWLMAHYTDSIDPLHGEILILLLQKSTGGTDDINGGSVPLICPRKPY